MEHFMGQENPQLPEIGAFTFKANGVLPLDTIWWSDFVTFNLFNYFQIVIIIPFTV